MRLAFSKIFFLVLTKFKKKVLANAVVAAGAVVGPPSCAHPPEDLWPRDHWPMAGRVEREAARRGRGGGRKRGRRKGEGA